MKDSLGAERFGGGSVGLLRSVSVYYIPVLSGAKRFFIRINADAGSVQSGGKPHIYWDCRLPRGI
ncbi:protein of unknown function (plasmid) [Cupriavidus neocaledonicus]|uniref:Uncharacterized protein n=1 Tax=Cupriavidus neocaledonicus TaxID=1040979 RepID=A0A375HMR0_9BURK|nr:hypothetical protein CBM2605_B130143 [Cupriavidus neocaledonicus]SPD59511.1 protein of unknown function [Cupriavidus neocaledonicus]